MLHHSTVEMPSKWENKVLKRKEHNKYHQNKDGKLKGPMVNTDPIPGKYAISVPPYIPPKKDQTIINGMKKRNETFMDCHDIFA